MTELEKYKALNKELEIENANLKKNISKDLKDVLEENKKIIAELEYIKTGRFYRIIKKLKSFKRG